MHIDNFWQIPYMQMIKKAKHFITTIISYLPIITVATAVIIKQKFLELQNR